MVAFSSSGRRDYANSNFFPFAGAFLPGHVERWAGGRKVIEIDEAVIVKSDYPPDFFSVPDTATGSICQNFRRAYAENTPNPCRAVHQMFAM
jgi:hypothetical protein